MVLRLNCGYCFGRMTKHAFEAYTAILREDLPNHHKRRNESLFTKKENTMTDSIIAKYYARENLPLHEDVPGSRMWAMALEKTMLTYFEVEPNCRLMEYAIHRQPGNITGTI